MKRYALEHYVCPISGEPLDLLVIKSRRINLDAEQIALANRLGIDAEAASTAIEEGILYSDKGGYWFPIINFVPILLDFPVDLHKDFAERYAATYDVLRRLSMPKGGPRQGETYVQKSFTREWAIMDLDVISFGLSPEQRDFFISLELDWPPGILDRDKLRILEVGCGSGFESASLFRVTKGTIFGFDLNLALLQKGHLLADNPFINNAVCSLYRLPLRESSFDIVYSSGTIHHTFSTVEALKQIVRFKKPDGLLYAWVYAREDSDYSLKARFSWLIEDIFRPRIARLPDFWQNMVVRILARRHYGVYKVVGGYNRDKWRRKDSEHFIRDRWTCLYAHRQSFNEMIRLFSQMGMEYKLIDPNKYYGFMKNPLIGIGIRGIHANGSADEAEIPMLHHGIEGVPTVAVVKRHPERDSRHPWRDSRFAKSAALIQILAGDSLGREALSQGAARASLNRPLMVELGRVIAAKRQVARHGSTESSAIFLPKMCEDRVEFCAVMQSAEAAPADVNPAELICAFSEHEIKNCVLVVEPRIAQDSFLLSRYRYELPHLLAWLGERPQRVARLISAGSSGKA
jgi:SAM-dependent methyltransferase/uncharacterized protein YbaR (Trm112 family)